MLEMEVQSMNEAELLYVDNTEQYEKALEEYLKKIIFGHLEQMSWYDLGFVDTLDCETKTMDDVYNGHLYNMS